MNLIDNIVTILDNGGKTADRYTAVIPYDASNEFNAKCIYFGFSSHPSHPLGVGMNGDSNEFIHRPKASHLGKRIYFADLPMEAQKVLWNWVKDCYIPISLAKE